ncbi:MAG TPA: hypothetical protein ENN19_10675 [Chloroflexi bacterium]|nr:hypothetical protein [Chloroflexota bacterium]
MRFFYVLSHALIWYLLDSPRLSETASPEFDTCYRNRVYDISLKVKEIPRQQVPDLPDRIIAATALYLDVPLITRDRMMALC